MARPIVLDQSIRYGQEFLVVAIPDRLDVRPSGESREVGDELPEPQLRVFIAQIRQSAE
jgi:hypothetical protein